MMQRPDGVHFLTCSEKILWANEKIAELARDFITENEQWVLTEDACSTRNVHAQFLRWLTEKTEKEIENAQDS
jgi:hypothetical protein